ncbi:MAG: succinylglutamate desuccinylase/aspartoacylase family protein [Planctomycetota bacterium]|nr:succinylglutamate desuccinylase/aspartoacylase family protein [Planctomycetota bacterium]MDA0935184.1 succinylglutamate desuccinylase/aspartoacylase family protein [Planctomycetota bacterium]
MAEPFLIGDAWVPPGSVREIELLGARLPTGTPLSIPVRIVHGKREGPVLWISACLHGDEISGLEIVRQVLQRVDPGRLRGTLLAVPIVNAYGFLQQSRYLPDGRDLNRSFPGSARGSLAARLAHLFVREIVDRSTHGIDLHTATRHRSNLAQVRADLEDEEARAFAEAFGAPVALHARTRDGSLRESAARRGKPVLVFEGGEALRFDPEVIRIGTQGVLQAMDHLGMLQRKRRLQSTPLVARRSEWLRAPRSGILRLTTKVGATVESGQILGEVSDPFGENAAPIRAPGHGLVIGQALLPTVHQGDAVLHIASFDDMRG